jgi:hypothetical protein
MSNMTLFSNGASVPAYLREATDDLTDTLAGNSNQYKRISIKGGVWRMMINGKEISKNEDRSMNFIVVAASPNNTRTFYSKSYVEGEALRPTCSSIDGTKPDANIEEPQAATCATCPQNIAGSGANNSRACRFSRRLAVMLENDMREEADVYQLVVPAQSLFGSGENGKLPLIAYAQFLKANNVRISGVVTEARFDTNSPTPKLAFRAVRPLTEEEYYFTKEKGKSTDALNAINLDPTALDKGAAPVAAPVSRPQPKAVEAPVAQVVEAPVDEPKKRESAAKKVETPANLESLLEEWED